MTRFIVMLSAALLLLCTQVYGWQLPSVFRNVLSRPSVTADTTAPTTTITSPDSDGSFDAGANTSVTLSGGAADNVAVDHVNYSCDNGISGTVVPVAGVWTAGVVNIALDDTTVCDATAVDTLGNADATPASISITQTSSGAHVNIMSTNFDSCPEWNSQTGTGGGAPTGDAIFDKTAEGLCAINDGIVSWYLTARGAVRTPSETQYAEMKTSAECYGGAGKCFFRYATELQWTNGFTFFFGPNTPVGTGQPDVTTLYVSYRFKMSTNQRWINGSGPHYIKMAYINDDLDPTWWSFVNGFGQGGGCIADVNPTGVNYPGNGCTVNYNSMTLGTWYCAAVYAEFAGAKSPKTTWSDIASPGTMAQTSTGTINTSGLANQRFINVNFGLNNGNDADLNMDGLSNDQSAATVWTVYFDDARISRTVPSNMTTAASACGT